MSELRHLVVDLKSGVTRPALPRSPILSSHLLGAGILLEQHSGGEAENVDVASQTHAVTVQLSNSAAVEWKQDGGSQRTIHKVPGQVSLFPAMSPASIRTRNTGELLIVALSPKFLKLATHEMTASNGIELIPRAPAEEPFLKTIALAMQAEAMAGNPGGKCYTETLASAIAAHLVRHHSSAGTLRFLDGGLAPAQFRRAVDYMHAHHAEDISLRSIADAAGLSAFHFSRLFKRSTGASPHQYLIRLRLERARELLLHSRDSMAQIALQSGFCDQSHFAMHFKRLYGVTPKAFARKLRGKYFKQDSYP